MSQNLSELAYDMRDIAANLVTEDDEPVDNMFSEKQQRLLTEPLYSSWQPPRFDDAPEERRKFIAASNVGVFTSVHQPPIVPDMFLSLDVEPNPEWSAKEHRSYFVWEFDKVPEVAVEIVSNRKGKEMQSKMNRYARMGVNYYVVFDPFRELGETALQIFEIGFHRYKPREDFLLPEMNLSLALWRGEFETRTEEWLRWCDAAGNLILTGKELARKEAERAQTEFERAQSAEERAATAEAEVARLKSELLRLQNL